MNQLPDIAFIGKAGAGKTTAAQWCEELGSKRMSFATGVRDAVELMWGAEHRNDRDKLQKLGTDVARLIDPDVWLNMFLRAYESRGEPNPVVVDDCRFENEYWALKARGFVIIRIEADEDLRLVRLRDSGKTTTREQLEHVSETRLDHANVDFTIGNTGDKLEFIERVSDTVKRYA